MLKEKPAYTFPQKPLGIEDNYGVSNFILKTISAALLGASIPAVIFYFLY